MTVPHGSPLRRPADLDHPAIAHASRSGRGLARNAGLPGPRGRTAAPSPARRRSDLPGPRRSRPAACWRDACPTARQPGQPTNATGSTDRADPGSDGELPVSRVRQPATPPEMPRSPARPSPGAHPASRAQPRPRRRSAAARRRTRRRFRPAAEAASAGRAPLEVARPPAFLP